VPTRQLVHLALDPALIHLEPEGDETVLSEGKPVGKHTVKKDNQIFHIHI
jgi:hypothetical protein